MAFLLLLEQLQPIERTVFLLREVFDNDYAEIASFLGKSEVACRQWFSRAKKHLGEHRPRFQASPDIQEQMFTGFLQAIQIGEMTPLMDMLAEEVTMWTDGGGTVKGAATRPITGREAVARFSLGASKRFLLEGSRVELAEVNGQPALIIRIGDRVYRVMTIEVEAQQIRTIRIIANPEKLARV